MSPLSLRNVFFTLVFARERSLNYSPLCSERHNVKTVTCLPAHVRGAGRKCFFVSAYRRITSDIIFSAVMFLPAVQLMSPCCRTNISQCESESRKLNQFEFIGIDRKSLCLGRIYNLYSVQYNILYPLTLGSDKHLSLMSLSGGGEGETLKKSKGKIPIGERCQSLHTRK